MGCIDVDDNFYKQIDCAMGLGKYNNSTLANIPNCARSRDANSIFCKNLKSGRTEADLKDPIEYPISTFDDFAEAHGPFSDTRGGGKGNCTSTYNVLIEV